MYSEENISTEFKSAYSAIREKKFPQTIKQFLDAGSKKEVEKLSKETTVPRDDIARMVLNSDLIGFKHSIMEKWFYPDDVLHTEEEKEAFSKIDKTGDIENKKAQKFLKKIYEQVKQRKVVTVHLLERNDEWHIFYFDFNDMYVPQEKNHYKVGPHIHYISYLFGDSLDKSSVLEQLEKRQTKINSIHIKIILD